MRVASNIIFRRITAADFFNIYKAPGTEESGGGQSYIDVDTEVSIAQWTEFLRPAKPELKAQNRPAWTVKIESIGLTKFQDVRIAQRRDTTVSIRQQKITSSQANRIYAWDPRYTDFPRPAHPPVSADDPEIQPLIDGLVVYLIRDSSGKLWAGWFKAATPDPTWIVPASISSMFTDRDGHILLNPSIEFDETDFEWPFGIRPSTGKIPLPSLADRRVIAAIRRQRGVSAPTEDEVLNELFDADEHKPATPTIVTRIAKVRVRNAAAVRLLKQLYGHQCQITGDKYVFESKDGIPYTEAHHLVPLGQGGSDSPLNLIVVSAHVHKLLHYADVPEISITDIENCRLDIKINSKRHRIEWHPKHARFIERSWKKSPAIS